MEPISLPHPPNWSTALDNRSINEPVEKAKAHPLPNVPIMFSQYPSMTNCFTGFWNVARTISILINHKNYDRETVVLAVARLIQSIAGVLIGALTITCMVIGLVNSSEFSFDIFNSPLWLLTATFGLACTEIGTEAYLTYRQHKFGQFDLLKYKKALLKDPDKLTPQDQADLEKIIHPDPEDKKPLNSQGPTETMSKETLLINARKFALVQLRKAYFTKDLIYNKKHKNLVQLQNRLTTSLVQELDLIFNFEDWDLKGFNSNEMKNIIEVIAKFQKMNSIIHIINLISIILYALYILISMFEVPIELIGTIVMALAMITSYSMLAMSYFVNRTPKNNHFKCIPKDFHNPKTPFSEVATADDLC